MSLDAYGCTECLINIDQSRLQFFSYFSDAFLARFKGEMFVGFLVSFERTRELSKILLSHHIQSRCYCRWWLNYNDLKGAIFVQFQVSCDKIRALWNILPYYNARARCYCRYSQDLNDLKTTYNLIEIIISSRSRYVIDLMIFEILHV